MSAVPLLQIGDICQIKVTSFTPARDRFEAEGELCEIVKAGHDDGWWIVETAMPTVNYGLGWEGGPNDVQLGKRFQMSERDLVLVARAA